MLGDGLLADVVATLPLEWVPTIDLSTLEHDKIHLWALDLSRCDIEAGEKHLAQAEVSRAQRILDREKRRLYLGGRIGLRILLSQYTGLDPLELGFGYGSRGKPVLANHLPGGEITFNYTLSKDKVLYAIARDRQIGVDMETLPRVINTKAMAERKLTDRERRAWEALPTVFGNDGMLCCWTRKEAYGKAIGVGIRYQLNAVNLFSQLASWRWQTPLAGVFPSSSTESMPKRLHGVQLQLPFNAVASLTYEIMAPKYDEPTLHSAILSMH